MCDFISIAALKQTEAIMSRWRRRGYALDPLDNPDLRCQLPNDHLNWVLTTGGCSCELIERHDAGNQDAASETTFGFRRDAAEILHALSADLDRCFLLVHHYSGNVASEKLPTLSRARRKETDLKEQMVFERDTIYELTK